MKKTICISAAIFIKSMCAIGQILPDPFPAPPSNSNFYYQNSGQIIDQSGATHPEIKFYTERTFPAIFLADDKVSFVTYQKADTAVANVSDSVARIDLKFVCNQGISKPSNLPEQQYCGEIKTYQQSEDHLNYYLPHCPNGIENVPGYARVVYEGAFPNIDVHFYSNAIAVKNYIVVKPGGNPNDVLFQFQGQDSINVLSSGSLSMYLRGWKMDFPQAIAYQIDASNNIIPVAWLPLWNHQGGGMVNILVGSYDLTKDLVISIGGVVEKPSTVKNLTWSTYYGSAGVQNIPLITSNQNNEVYHVVNENSGIFPPFNGQFEARTYQDYYISKFDNLSRRKWATYYGGSQWDQAADIEEAHPGTPNGELWIGGWTWSNDVPLGPVTGNFKQTGAWRTEGLLSSFSKDLGHLKYATYFGAEDEAGAEGYDEIHAISIDNVDNLIYIGGNTDYRRAPSINCSAPTLGSFPLCPGTGRFFMSNNSSGPGITTYGGDVGFIAEIAIPTKTLQWSTFLGGKGGISSPSKIQSILKVNNGFENSLYVGGRTQVNENRIISSSTPVTSCNYGYFPLVNPGNGAFVQSSFNTDYPYYGDNFQSFIAKFNNEFKLSWSTLLGTTGSDGGVVGLAMNSQNHLYAISNQVVHVASPISQYPNSLAMPPVYSDGISYMSTTGQTLLAKFGTNKQLLWATKHNIFMPSLAVDTEDKVFLTGYTYDNNTPRWYAASGYWQPDNASLPYGLTNTPEDGHISVFNRKGQVLWGTYFGGTITPSTHTQDANSIDRIYSVSVSGNSNMYITGHTRCPFSPYDQDPGNNAYFDPTYNTGMDCFISRFNITNINPDEPVGISDTKSNLQNALLVYPNPSNDVFKLRFGNQTMATTAKFSILDQIGRVVKTSEYKINKGENTIEISLEGISDAVYYIEVVFADQSLKNKLLKLKNGK